MGNMRKWASQVTKQQRKKFTKGLTAQLFQMIKEELSSETPDYYGCVVALTTLHRQTIGEFYKNVYRTIPANAQESIDNALLTWANDKVRENRPVVCSRVAEVITQRLRTEDTDRVVPLLQWHISTLSGKNADSYTKQIRENCGEKNLQKLLALDLQEWEVSRKLVKNFYQILFENSSDTKTQKMYQAFLSKNYLNNSPVRTEKNNITDTDTAGNMAAELNVDENEQQKQPDSNPAKDISGETEISITSEPDTKPKTESMRESNGVALAEMLLAWSKKQVRNTAALREIITRSDIELKTLQAKSASLSAQLRAAQEELSEKERAITGLRQTLEQTGQELAAAQRRAQELDETVSKLQRMNENSSSQAVTGYQAGLAAALKSVVEDASLPEARNDADILSTLLGDILDVLRFKGVPLEGQ